MRVAMIEDGEVKNVVISDTVPNNGVASDVANIGDSYDGAIFTTPVVVVTPDYKFMAQMALDRSDLTILRCMENGISVPSDWTTYRSELRAIVKSGGSSMPTQPAYPTGT